MGKQWKQCQTLFLPPRASAGTKDGAPSRVACVPVLGDQCCLPTSGGAPQADLSKPLLESITHSIYRQHSFSLGDSGLSTITVRMSPAAKLPAPGEGRVTSSVSPRLLSGRGPGPPQLSCVHLFCNPMDCNPAGCSVHGISQAKILEWAAISYTFFSKEQASFNFTAADGDCNHEIKR